MLSKNNQILVAIFFGLGAFIQIVTSLTWVYLSTDKLGNGEATVGEAYMMVGQAAGELIWLLAVRLFVVNKLLVGELLLEYLIGLILVDLISIIFFNPYQIELPKYSAFAIATLIFLHRLKIYMKK